MNQETTLPNPEDVSGFPKNEKAVMIKVPGGHVRVIERHYYWNKEKKRGCEKRDYLGYVVDNRFYSNDEYQKFFKRDGRRRLVPQSRQAEQASVLSFDQIDSLETRIAAEFPVYHAIAKDIGLVDDLTTPDLA